MVVPTGSIMIYKIMVFTTGSIMIYKNITTRAEREKYRELQKIPYKNGSGDIRHAA